MHTKKKYKKLSGNFGYMGRSNPWGDLDQMWLVGRYGGNWSELKPLPCVVDAAVSDADISLPTAETLTHGPRKHGVKWVNLPPLLEWGSRNDV